MGDIKEELIGNILISIKTKINNDDIQFIRNALICNLFNVDITKKETTIVNVSNNDKNLYFMKKFWINKKGLNLADSSFNQYKRAVINLVNFTGGKCVTEITSDDVSAYLAYNMSKNDWKPSYANTIRMYLRSFYNYLDDYFDSFDSVYTSNPDSNSTCFKNPMRRIGIIKSEFTKKDTLFDTEIDLMHKNCINEQELALFEFLMSTGLRVSEVVNLKISDIDFKRNTVSVYGVKTKKWRETYMTKKAKKYLLLYLKTRTDDKDILFLSPRGKVCNKSRIEKILNNIAKRANVTKHCTVHTIRRTFATLMFRRGLDLVTVSKLMGHSNCRITEMHYLVLLTSEIQSKFNACVD